MFSIFNCFAETWEVRKNQTESWSCDFSAKASWALGFYEAKGKRDVSFHISNQYVALDGGKKFIVRKGTKLTNLKSEEPLIWNFICTDQLNYFGFGDASAAEFYRLGNGSRVLIRDTEVIGGHNLGSMYPKSSSSYNTVNLNASANLVFSVEAKIQSDSSIYNYLTLTFDVDDDSPTITGLPANEWTNKRDLYFNASDKTTNIYKIDVKNADNYENLGNNNYYLRLDDVETTVYLDVYDEVLNVTNKKIKTDFTKPKISIDYPSSEEWQNKDVTIDLTVEDELSGIKRIKVIDEFTGLDCKPFKSNAEGNIYKEQSYKITGTGVHEIKIEAEDYAGNISTKTIYVSIDKDPAEVKASCDKTGQWTNEDVTINIEAEDKDSGLKQVWIEVDGKQKTLIPELQNNWLERYNGIWKETEEGKRKIKIKTYAKDAAGNTSKADAEYQIWIDRSKPEIEIEPKEEKEWSNSEITVNIKMTDQEQLSGINEKTIQITDNGTKIKKYNTKDISNGIQVTFKLEKDGEHNINVTCKDNAGNEAEKSITYKIDKKAIDTKNITIEAEYSEDVIKYRDELSNPSELAGDVKKLIILVKKYEADLSEPDNVIVNWESESVIVKNKSYELRYDENQNEYKYYKYEYDIPEDLDEGTYHNISIKVMDEAGNESEKKCEVVIDRTAARPNVNDFNIDLKKVPENKVEIQIEPNNKDIAWIFGYKKAEDYGTLKDKTDLYKKGEKKSIIADRNDDGVYTIHVENVDQYGNHSGRDLYLLWSDGGEGPEVEQGYDNSKEGYMSYLKITPGTKTVNVNGKNITYIREYFVKYKDDNEISKTLSFTEGDTDEIKIYIIDLKYDLKGWRSNNEEDDRKVEVYYEDTYDVEESEEQIIKAWSGQSQITEWTVKDSAPKFNEYIKWPDYVSGNIALSCVCPSDYTGFEGIAADPDGDEVIFKITLKNDDGDEKYIYRSLSNITNEIEIPKSEGLKKLTVTIQAKGIREQIKDGTPVDTETWNKAGSENESKYKEYSGKEIDFEAPVLTESDDRYWNSGDQWTNETTTALKFADVKSGLKSIYVGYFKGEEILPYKTEEETFEESGKYTVNFKPNPDTELCGEYYIGYVVTDRAGNKLSNKTEPVQIDSVKPVIGDIKTETGSRGDVTINLSVTDEGSGVNQYQYRIKTGESWSDWYIYKNTINIAKGSFSGKDRTVEIQVRDNALNESKVEKIPCKEYEEIPAIKEIVFEGVDEKGYVTDKEKLQAEIKFVGGTEINSYTAEWKSKNVKDGEESVYEDFAKLKEDLKEGKEYILTVAAENGYGSRTEKTGAQSIKIVTKGPSPIRIETNREMIKGQRHEVTVCGGLDKNCEVERTVYAVIEKENGEYKVIYRKALESDLNEDIVEIKTELFEEEIRKVSIYAESVNEAGLITRSEMINGFEIIQGSGLIVDADEYTSGSIFASWTSGNSKTREYEYKIIAANKEIAEGTTENRNLTYDISEDLNEGTFIYINVTGLDEEGKETESRKSGAIIYSRKHPEVEWTKVPKAAKSQAVWAGYKVETGIGIKEISWTAEVFEKDKESGEWSWNGINEDGTDKWEKLTSKEGKVQINVEELITNGRISNGSSVRFIISAENKAGLETRVMTGAIVIDDTKPPVPVVTDQGDVISQTKEESVKVDWSTSFDDKESGSTYYWRWYVVGAETAGEEWTEAEWNEGKTEQNKTGTIGDTIRDERYDGGILIFEVKAVNGTGEESISRTDGILLDSNAPVIKKIELYAIDSSGTTEGIGGYTEIGKIKDSLYVKMTVKDETSWAENGEAVLYEIGEDGELTERCRESLKVEGETAEATIKISGNMKIKKGSRFVVQAAAYDAAENRSGSASSQTVVLTGSPAKVKQIKIQGDTKKLNINWVTEGDPQWTKKYIISISSEILPKTYYYYEKTTSLTVAWEELGINLADNVNGYRINICVSPEGYTSGISETVEESFMIDLKIPEFNEKRMSIPDDRTDIRLTAWADEITAYVEYIAGVTGCSVEWASTYAEDGSEISGWKRIKHNIVTVREKLSSLSWKEESFWHNKRVMLRFKAVNQMGLSSPEKKTTPVLIDLTKPETVGVKREWAWTNQYRSIDEMKIKGGDKESGVTAYISALIMKEDAETEDKIKEALKNGNIREKEISHGSENIFEDNAAEIPVVEKGEGIYKAVLGVRNGSGLWTYEKSEDIEIDRTAPKLNTEESSFDSAQKQIITLNNKPTEVYVINGPIEGFRFVSTEEGKWKIHGDGQILKEVTSEGYQEELKEKIDLSQNSEGNVYKLIIEMTDRAGNTGIHTEYIRYNKAPEIKVLTDKSGKITVWPGHTKSIAELFEISDREDKTEGDYPLTYTWIPGNETDGHSWTGGMSGREIFGTEGEYKTPYYQKDKTTQVSEYRGKLIVTDCYGKESSADAVITVENTRSGALLVDEYWTGDHLITGTVTVPEGITLTLKDAEITAGGYMDGNTLESGIEVHGSMDVEGEVKITGERQTIKWKGIKVKGELEGETLEIEKAERGITELEGGKVKIKVLKLDDCVTGLHLFGGMFETENMTITNSSQYGIKEEAEGQYKYGNPILEGNGRNLYRAGTVR